MLLLLILLLLFLSHPYIAPGHMSFPWLVLGVHIAAALSILLWSVFWSTLLFGPLKYYNFLRVSTEMEFKGMDLVKHGEAVRILFLFL